VKDLGPYYTVKANMSYFKKVGLECIFCTLSRALDEFCQIKIKLAINCSTVSHSYTQLENV